MSKFPVKTGIALKFKPKIKCQITDIEISDNRGKSTVAVKTLSEDRDKDEDVTTQEQKQENK